MGVGWGPCHHTWTIYASRWWLDVIVHIASPAEKQKYIINIAENVMSQCDPTEETTLHKSTPDVRDGVNSYGHLLCY